MERKFRVYRYQNLIVPSASYIGRTCQKYQSNRAGKNGSHYLVLPKFGPAIETYGWPNFEYSVLEDGLTEEESYEREKYWINYYDSVNQGYNDSIGGRYGSFGVHRSDETKKRMSDSHRLSYMKGNNLKNLSKPVLQYTKDGEFIARYSSMTEAQRWTGIRNGVISNCCSGRCKTAGGSIWRYAP